jgi:hypothetical protein
MRPPATIAVRPSNDPLSPPHTSLVALSVRAALLYWHWLYCVKVAVVGPQVSLDSVSSISLYCTRLSTPLQHVLAPPDARSCIPLFHPTPSMFRVNLAGRFLDGRAVTLAVFVLRDPVVCCVADTVIPQVRPYGWMDDNQGKNGKKEESFISCNITFAGSPRHFDH